MQKPPELEEPLERAADGETLESLRKKLEDYENWFRTLDNQIRSLESERQNFSALVNYTDAGFVVVDPDARVLWTNSVFNERFSNPTTPDSGSLGLTCSEALCRKPQRCDDCPAAKLFETGQVAHHELNLLMGDRFHHVYTTAIPVRSQDGKLEQAIIMLQDLTDLQVLRRSEEALRTTEERFRSIFQQAGAGMVTVRADGSFLQVNPTFCTMLGYTESELLRKKITEVTHDDDKRAVHLGLVDVGTGRSRATEMEQRFVRRDGNTVWCHTTGVWQFDRNDRPTFSVVLVHDISERKHAEQALALSQKQYEVLVHSIDGIVWEADPKAFRFSFVSRQAERILGYPVDRWLAQPRFWRNNIHPNDLEQVVAALADAVDEKRGGEFEYRMLASDGRTVWVRDTVSMVLRRGKVTKLRGMMVDVTERKAAEEALRKSEEQLRQSQKMEAIGRLAGGIAHDFNNLLTAITGYGDFLIRGLGDEHPLQREANEIYKAAQRAADLTGQLLAFSRQQVLQPKVLDLKWVVADMELMLHRLIGEHIELTTDVEAPIGAVKADPGQLQQVILNLVVNGRDAMSDGGTLRIETQDVALDETYTERHPGMTPGEYVMLAVSDQGCGMDEETKARLFEPFFTTKEQGKGTGLGLSTVYGIVTQSGGHISVHSAPGEGSTFKVYLPRIDNPEVTGPKVPDKPAAEPATGTERILLVEDDDSVRELAREILEMHGYHVVEASNGVEALAVFEAETDKLDLMVTDLVMPQMGGRDLAKKIAPDHPDLRVLYLSGYTDSVVLHQGMLDPGSFFLQKPFTPADLAIKVREALDT